MFPSSVFLDFTHLFISLKKLTILWVGKRAFGEEATQERQVFAWRLLHSLGEQNGGQIWSSGVRREVI